MCGSRRAHDAKRDATLSLYAYYRGSEKAVYAAKAAAALSRALSEGAYAGDERLVHTYLAGELSRRAGDFASATPVPPRGENGPLAGLLVWAREQLAATPEAPGGEDRETREPPTRPETPSRPIAPEAADDPDGFEAWLRGFTPGQRARKVAVTRSEAVIDLANRLDLSWEALLELNPALRDPGDRLGPGDEVLVPNVPPGRDEGDVLDGLPPFLERGMPPAFAFLADWARRNGSAAPGGEPGGFIDCLEALAGNESLWPAARSELSPVGEPPGLLAECLLLATDAAPDFSGWADRVRAASSRERRLLLAVLAAKRSLAAWDAALKIAQSEGLSIDLEAYLARAGGKAELERLEAVALAQCAPFPDEEPRHGSRGKGSRQRGIPRRDLERLIRQIRLREALGDRGR
ncbi:MAG: hypothetical protein HY721_26625 [Planctomycetes bacterium]|nr:hypothetical protein [Planctomycetota bacterium]